MDRFTRCAIKFFRVQRTGVVFRSILLNGQGKGRTSIAALDPGYGHCANSVRHPSTSFVRVWTATSSLNSRGRMTFRPCWPNSKGSLTLGRGGRGSMILFSIEDLNSPRCQSSSWGLDDACLSSLRRGSSSICTYRVNFDIRVSFHIRVSNSSTRKVMIF